MRTRIIWAAGLALVAAGCNDRSRASNDVKWNDRPADISCWTYGVQSFQGRSTGRVGYDEGGRISFVDAANGRYTTVEGDCRVVYLTADEESAAPTAASTPPEAAAQASAQ